MAGYIYGQTRRPKDPVLAELLEQWNANQRRTRAAYDEVQAQIERMESEAGPADSRLRRERAYAGDLPDPDARTWTPRRDRRTVAPTERTAI